MTLQELLRSEVRVVNVGLRSFAEDLERAGAAVVHVDWRPPAEGDLDALRYLTVLQQYAEQVDAANRQAFERLQRFQPALVALGLAGQVIPGMTRDTVLHAGPPVTWDRMCGPQRGAVVGALLFEGLAPNPAEAEALAASGRIRLLPCHQLGAVGPMAGVISASMPVIVVENQAFGNLAYSNLNEGLGKVLRFGAFSPDVLQRLAWMRDELAPALNAALSVSGPIDLRNITARALQMGDECHNRNVAATSLFSRMLMPALIQAVPDRGVVQRVATFLADNDHFYLNLSMAACKSGLDAAHGVEHSTLVTAMARNGTAFGIRVSGQGDRWFTAEAPMVEGLYFTGFSAADANRDMGDSAICETFGIGGFSMAAAPAIVTFVGGTTDDAVGYTQEMGRITLGQNPNYTLPTMNFAPSPMGIEVQAVVRTSIRPVINTGIAHKEPGVGQIGAGIVRAPIEIFRAALAAAAEGFAT